MVTSIDVRVSTKLYPALALGLRSAARGLAAADSDTRALHPQRLLRWRRWCFEWGGPTAHDPTARTGSVRT